MTASSPTSADSAAATLDTPWLSVLIPVHNVRPYLAECVESAMAQAGAGIEVLIVEDCSTDGSDALVRELVERYAGHAARLRAIFHERNQGISGTRNTLLREAHGAYFWFLDSDDYLMPGSILALRALIDREAPAMVLCDYRMVREHMTAKHHRRGELHKRTFVGPERQHLTDVSLVLRGLLLAGQMHVWSKIARREVWDGLRFPLGRYFEDMTLSPLLGLQARDTWYEPQVWVAYRQREGSILHTLNLDKAEHLAHALADLRVAAQGRPLDHETLFAWAHIAARNFIGSSRMAQRFEPATCDRRIASFRLAFEEATPIPLRDLAREYLRRGWWVRALRLRYWLRRAESLRTTSAA